MKPKWQAFVERQSTDLNALIVSQVLFTLLFFFSREEMSLDNIGGDPLLLGNHSDI